MTLGSTQPLTEISIPRVFHGGKGGRCVRLTTLPPSCAVVTKSGNLNFLETSGPLQACNGTALPFILRGPKAPVFIPISKYMYSQSFILLDKYSNFYYWSICFNITMRHLFSKNIFFLWDFPTKTSLHLQFPHVCYILCTPFSTLLSSLLTVLFPSNFCRFLSHRLKSLEYQKPSRVLCCVDWYTVTYISNGHMFFIFNVSVGRVSIDHLTPKLKGLLYFERSVFCWPCISVES